MDTPPDTVEQWRVRLAESERSLAAGAVRLAWLRRIYIRVYRFLISCYGEGNVGSVSSSVTTSKPDMVTGFPLIDNTEGSPGCEPKSAERIRTTLNNLHAANEEPPAGPLEKGPSSSTWFVVASENAHLSPKRCHRLFESAGISARVVRRGDDRMVEVPMKDREAAFALIERNRSELKVRARLRKSRPLGAAYGLIMGAALFGPLLGAAAIALGQTGDMPEMTVRALLGGLSGAIAGWWLGLPRIRKD